MLPAGRIDTHCHILPGVDDGCPGLTETLNCIQQLIAAGYIGSICTPHIIASTYPRNTPGNVQGWVADLQAELDRHGISYQLWAGGEVLLHADNWALFERDGVPTLGTSRAVLLDWWGSEWPEFGDTVLDRLLEENYQPILAHPERMKLKLNDLQALIDDLTSRGVWLQGNLNSLSGGEGSFSEELSQRWLQEGLYHILASDTHHPDRMSGRLNGLRKAIELVGVEQVAELTAHRTWALVR